LWFTDAVLSKTQLAVCKAIGLDSGWHSGFVQDQRCNYEYNGGAYQAYSYEVTQYSTFICTFKTLQITNTCGTVNRQCSLGDDASPIS